jgi:hypothetical protein
MGRANAMGPGVRGARRGRWQAAALAGAVLLAVLLPSACGSVSENAGAVTCAAGGTDGSGTGGAPGTGGEAGNHPNLAVPDDVIVLPCSICVRAQNCCKAQGLTDCNYAAACAGASSAEQNQFYLVLCQAVLSAPNTGGKKTADSCGF